MEQNKITAQRSSLTASFSINYEIIRGLVVAAAFVTKFLRVKRTHNPFMMALAPSRSSPDLAPRNVWPNNRFEQQKKRIS